MHAHIPSLFTVALGTGRILFLVRWRKLDEMKLCDVVLVTRVGHPEVWRSLPIIVLPLKRDTRKVDPELFAPWGSLCNVNGVMRRVRLVDCRRINVAWGANHSFCFLFCAEEKKTGQKQGVDWPL